MKTAIFLCFVLLLCSSCGPRFETADLREVDSYLQEVATVRENALLMEKDDANTAKKRLKYMLDAMDDLKSWPDAYKEGGFKPYIMGSPEMRAVSELMAKNLSAMVESGGITAEGQKKILREHYLLKLSQQ
ncbi:MAG: hypothetical protein HRU15_02850 [Planctomycetes bacterium]|nr:hypothetical protein [Planctomycetota bacterium]